MANIIAGDHLTFDALCGFTSPSESCYEFMNASTERFRSRVQSAATGFFEKTRDLYRRVDRDELARRAKAALRQVNQFFRPNEISTLETIEELQHAPDVMLPYLMAQPLLRRMYLSQRCDGYSDRYENYHGNAVHHNHADYQAVMSGIWHEDPTEGYVCHIYENAIVDENFTLSLRDTNHVRLTWEHLVHMIELGGDDPTSKYNAKL